MHTSRKLSLESRLIQFIKRNSLSEGTRLPSIAVLSKQFRAGKDTISTALQELHNDGIIEIRKNDGCYIMPSAWEFLYKGTPNWGHLADKSWFGKEHIEWRPARPDTINISVGHLSDEFAYNTYIADAVKESAKMIRSNNFKYDIDPRGSLSFREAIQNFLKNWKGIECEPSQIIHTFGSNQSIMIIIQSLLNYDTPLCVATPNALSTMTLIDAYGIRQVEYEENNLESLKTSLAHHNKAVYIVSPNSAYPTGNSIYDEFRDGLMTYAHKRKLPIVEIDSHNDLSDTSTDTLKSTDTKDSIIYGGTLMNVFTIGIPVNWLVVPMQMVDRFADIVAKNNVIPSTLPQLAVELMMRENVIEDYFRQAKKIFRDRVRLTNELFEKYLSPYAVWNADNIGLSAWVEMKDRKYAQAVLDAPELFVLSGGVFGKTWGNFLSICPCNQSEENLTKGIRLMNKILSECR